LVKSAGVTLRNVSDVSLLMLMMGHLDKVQGRKRLQKLVFLLQKCDKTPFQYSFISYLYGPYCSDLQNDVDRLVSAGYITEDRTNYLYSYEVTREGKNVSREIEKKYGKNKAKQLYADLDKLDSHRTEDLVKRSKQIMSGMV